ncbi:MAG: hypothetical protein WB622_13450 [Acidobacteriaceae bacterium]|jgi:plastocyanin
MNSWTCFRWSLVASVALLAAAVPGRSQENGTAELRLRIQSSRPGVHRAVPAVIWLDPAPGTPVPAFVRRAHYTLVQKNRTFIPHMQVIPVGSVVQFPNEDPFFHNVFSLFDGKRFDLGLYEAGSSKSVTFSRVGVSYIFCNIHPEMSAVVIALATPLFAAADSHDAFVLPAIPTGDYTLHLWIEGVPQSVLEHLSRPVHIPPGPLNLGVIQAPIPPTAGTTHNNLYGKPYAEETPSPY